MYPQSMNATPNVVANIRGLMGEAHVTQTQLAQVLGLSQAAIAKRISERRSVVLDVEEIDKIADYFGVPVQSLFDPPRVQPFRGVGDTHEYTPPKCVTAGTTRDDWALAS